MLLYSFKARRVISVNNLCISIRYEHQRFRQVYPRDLAVGKVNDVSSNTKHILM